MNSSTPGKPKSTENRFSIDSFFQKIMIKFSIKKLWRKKSHVKVYKKTHRKFHKNYGKFFHKKSWKIVPQKNHGNVFPPKIIVLPQNFFKKIEKGRIQFETEFMESKFPVKLGLLFVDEFTLRGQQ